jgi:hypothetical protein
VTLWSLFCYREYMAKLLVLLVLTVTAVCGVVTHKTMKDWTYGGAAKNECESTGGRWDQKQLYCHR